MACGTPVLAFAGGSVEEIVRNGMSGWICDDRDDMARRVASLDVRPQDCRDFADKYFSVATMADRYLEVYEHALNRPNTPSPTLAHNPAPVL